jgi:serine/threonine-protein kinase
MIRILKDGQVVNGQYEVERFLGEGAFAEVWRVKHRFLGRQAMKVFKAHDADANAVEKRLSEAMLLSRIGHPNIVRVFDANVLETPGGIHGYFTMENVAGGTLDKFWRSFGDEFVPVETVVDILRQVCCGLSVAHGEKPPVIHRDIKPQNILVGYEADGIRVRLSDFGLAKQVSPLSLLASAAGTLAFKPPEVFADGKADSAEADVFSLGVTAYLLLTDSLPYAVDDGIGWVPQEAFNTPPPRPSSINRDVDAALERIVLKCLEMKPGARFRNAKEVLKPLETWQPQKTPPADGGKTALDSVSAKSVFGERTQPDEEKGRELAKHALRLARENGRLAEAANLMEEAFNESPALRTQYASKVSLWRAGVCM